MTCRLIFIFSIIICGCIVGEKIDIEIADASTIIPALLVTIQSDMFIKAKAGRDEKMATVLKWEDFVPALERDCLVLTPFCDLAEWEEKVKVHDFLTFYEMSYFWLFSTYCDRSGWRSYNKKS